jgi:hypothetical protein
MVLSDFNEGDHVIIMADYDRLQGKGATVVRTGIWDVCVKVPAYPHLLWYSPDELEKVEPAPAPTIKYQYMYVDAVSGRVYDVQPFLSYV